MSKTRMGKRVASLLLSLVMMLSLLPTTVYAEGADTGDTTDEIVGQATTSGDNTEGTGEPEPTGEGEDGSANVSEGEDGAATNDAVVEETIAPVNAEGVDAVANAESGGDKVSGEDGSEAGNKAETYVAQVGDTKYATLKDAIAAAEAGQTVTLLTDVSLTSTQAISKQLTIDLNGKTISSPKYRTIQLNAGADLTVKDSASVGKITNTYTGSAYPSTIYLRGADAKFTLESGTIESDPNVTSLRSVAINSEKNWACVVNIKGGSVTVPEAATKGRAIVASTSMTLNISGGTIAGGLHGVDAYSGSNVNITGGEITARYVDTGVIKEAYGMRLIGTANVTVAGGEITGVKMDDNGYKGDVPAVKLKSGSINGSFYSISHGTIIFAVVENADIVLENDSAAKFLPDTVKLVQNANGTYSIKAGTYVAEYNGTKYESLAEAITAAESGATVTLLADCASDRINLETKSITVDLNGKTLTSTAAYGVMFCAKNGKTITINGTTEGSKLVGTLMVTNGTYGHIVINGGTYESDKYCPIYINGAVSTDDSTLTVTNATIEALAGSSDQDNGVAVYLAGYSTSTFTNTTITAPVTGLEIRAGKLTLTDCNVTGGNGAVAAKADGSGSTVVNAAVAISQHTTKKDIDVTITGGTYTATAAVYQTDVQGTGSEGVKANIKAGTFNGTVSAATNNTVAVSGGSFSSAVPENCCAAGFIPNNTKDANGYYGVKEGQYVAQVGSKKYETLQAAINAASRKATVKLLADTKENVTISTPYLTLDLNGFTLNGGTGERKPALTITARVTVMDSSEAKTGTIMREDTAENSGVSSHYVIDIQGAGWLTFESGNVKNDSGAGGTKGASLVRVGDDSVDKYPGLNIKGGTFTQDNFIVIKVDSGDLFLNGGTLNSTNSYAIEDWHRATVKGGTVNGTVAAWTYSGGHNSTLEISGGTIKGNVASVSYDKAEGKLAKVSITGGTVTGTLGTYTYNNGLESITDAAKATIEITGGTFSSDPSAYLVESSSVTKNSDGTFGVAKAYLARIGETFYYTMEDAFQAQTNGDTIVLLRDYTTGGTFNSGSINRTVDLNDHTWTCTGTDANSAAFEINYPNASLTVKNGKIVSSQLVGLIPSAMGGTIKYDNSSLTFENVEMSTTATSGIETNGNNTSDAVTLKDSTLNVPNGFGIYFPSSGTLTIDNSTITAKTMGVQVCAGSLSISAGSAITVSGDAVSKTENDGAIQDGAAISIVNRNGYKGLGNVTVTGGTFTAKTDNAAIKAYNWDNNTESDWAEAGNNINISGGTFSSAVKEEYCATGYIPTTNSDGTHGVKEGQYVAQVGNVKYESLAAAIGAAQDGDTVTLLKDIDLPATAVVEGKTITLELNGKTLANTKDIWDIAPYDWSLISVREGGNLTINGSGALRAKENDCYALDVQDGGNLTVNGDASYVGNIHAIYVQKGTATVNGGSYSVQQKYPDAAKADEFVLNCYDANRANGTAKIIVNGGTFTNFDPRNNKAEGAGTSFVAEGVGVNADASGNFVAKANMLVQLVDADGNSVAAYDNLDRAFYYAQDEKNPTLIVLQDIVDSIPVSIIATNTTDSITLDLNGHNISFVENEWSAIWSGFNIQNAAALDLIITGKGTITAAASNVAAICVQGLNLSTRTTLTIDEDVTVVASTGVLIDMYRADGQASCGDNITVNIAGTVKNTSESEDYAISVNGEITKQQPTINVMSTAKIEANGWGMYLAGNNKTNIASGAQISGTVTGIEIRAGELTLDGCTVTGGNGELTATANGNGATVRNAAIAVSQHATELPITVNIKSGTYTGTAAVYQSDAQGTASENVKVSIENGTFLGKVEAKTAGAIAISGGSFSTDVKGYCVDTYTTVHDADADMYNVVPADAKITVGKRLLIGNNLTITYLVNLTGCREPWVEFEFYSDETKTYTKRAVRTYGTDKVLGPDGETMVDVYTFDFTGINPQRMTDTLRATVYAEDGAGNTVEYQVGDYSVAQYCSNKLAKISENDSLRMLIGNLVAYGAASQKYMNYHLNMKVSDSVTGTTPTVYGKAKTACVGTTHVDSSGVTIKGKTLVLSNAFAIRVYFTLADGVNDKQVSFNVTTNDKQAAPVASDAFKWDEANNCWYFDYANLNATQLDSKVKFTANVGDAAGDTLEYSVNTYLAKVLGDSQYAGTKLYDLCYALFHYGWACQAYAKSN